MKNTHDTAGAAPATDRHPLDPLTREEIATTVGVLRGAPQFRTGMRFVGVTLHEPPKPRILAYTPDGEPIEREAFAVLLDPADGVTYEAIVALDAGELRSWRPVPGVQAAITLDEYVACEQAVRADARFQQALRARGIADPDLVLVEAWGIGAFEQARERGRRLVWTPCWVRDHAADNAYAHPIEGLYAIVDLNAMEVIRLEDHGAIPVPPEAGNYTPAAVGALRGDLKTLDIVQPEGPSFAVGGWQVQWQKWRFRIGFTPREGLVLHTVGYEDGGRERPILYRASYVELVVPYGDPGPGGYRRNAFDIGEYGLGPLTNSLERGCDCLGEIRYFDVELCTGTGEPYTVRNAICLHEEDAGLLWKHYDAPTDHAEVRRSRRLVVSSIATANNYEYAFYWYFYQDGTIEAEVKLTGIVLTAGVAPGESPDYGRLIAPGLSAPNHQHFFNVRLDLDVDGPRNTVCEVHTESAPPGPENPYGNAFAARTTPLLRELEAQQCVDPLAARYWRIVNRDARNRLGEPVAYKLVPGKNILPFAQADADILRRAGFITKHLWVTPYETSERYPAGDYPNQHPGGAGLPEWTAANRSIAETDLVVWYTFGSHHIVRPEDWPVMPVVRAGFSLEPDGFFDRNPALDVPPSRQGSRPLSLKDSAARG